MVRASDLLSALCALHSSSSFRKKAVYRLSAAVLCSLRPLRPCLCGYFAAYGVAGRSLAAGTGFHTFAWTAGRRRRLPACLLRCGICAGEL